MSEAITLERIEKSYGRRTVLDGLDLAVPEGSVFAFLGNNGHGKSTTIRLISGLSAPDRGTVRLFGRDIARAKRDALRETGFLIEAPSAYPNLTAAEFLRIGVALKALPASEIARCLRMVGLHEDRDRRIEHFSLGMRQRLALAHALLGAPRLLVLDEPTNGLDPDGIQEIRTLLRGLPDASGCTIFFASHYLDEVEKTATHLAVLHDGRIRARTTVEALGAQLASALALRVDDAGRAAEALRAQGHAPEVDGPHALTVAASDHAAAGRINAALFAAGVTLYESTLRRPRLEEWFLRLTGAAGERAA